MNRVAGRMASSKKRRKKRSLIRRYGLDCWLCGEPMTESTATIDHVVPLSKGGANDLTNLRLAHKLCNIKRGNRHPPKTSQRHGDGITEKR